MSLPGIKSHWFIKPLILVALALLLLNIVPPLSGVKTSYMLTDKLVFLLLTMVVFFVAYLRTQPHLLEPWVDVLRNRRAMASAVVLLFFVIIGLLDSIHYREPLPVQEGKAQQYSIREISLLDTLATPFRKRTEKTYSAPLAVYGLSKEVRFLADGRKVREYPRLKYAGANLHDPATEFSADISWRIAWGIITGTALLAIIVVLFLFVGGHRANERVSRLWLAIVRSETELPWRVALITALLLFVAFGVMVSVGLNYHVLGTDKVGNDVFYLAIKSIRTGLVIGTLTTLVMMPFAILLGIAAGYFRGWVDDVIQYLYTTLNSIPGVLLIAAAILSIQVYISNHQASFETSSAQADLRLLALCIILGITSWTGLCRLLRGETLKLREMDYITAASAFGVRPFRTIRRHIMPNVMHIVLIVIVIDFSGLVLAEAVLSYVGVGVDPSTISWGNMINNARLEMGREPMVWWSLVAAFVFMFMLVLAANLFSDAVRDAFDPRLRDGSR
jgi:peptide/nickel transport system permease protein